MWNKTPKSYSDIDLSHLTISRGSANTALEFQPIRSVR